MLFFYPYSLAILHIILNREGCIVLKEEIVQQLHQSIKQRNQLFVKETNKRSSDSPEGRKLTMHASRGAQIVRSYVEGDVLRSTYLGKEHIVEYVQMVEQLIKQKEFFYIEEKLERRVATFVNGKLKEDQLIEGFEEATDEEKKDIVQESRDGTMSAMNRNTDTRSGYDRRAAVQYAERWWNDENPQYKSFTNNCTNFISQCLRAGGAPMSGVPNRSKGWWYQSNNWSYSWSVAHAFRWYLSGATTGLRGEERDAATDLEPGDIICYDFDGDGRWQHTTIVVAKDANGEPLVNAQTSNSRMRYWKYEDSTAWTPNITYKFFHILT